MPKHLASVAALLSWFAGGVLLGLIEFFQLPQNPAISTALQLLPLLFLGGGIWFVISEYQRLRGGSDLRSTRLRYLMIFGWISVFGVNAGIASINNMSNVIFHAQIPYYFQGISSAQKVIALAGVFVLGLASVLSMPWDQVKPVRGTGSSDFWEKPLTNIGFIVLLIGVVLGLAQYWSIIIFAGFFLLLAGLMLYPVGRLTEKDIQAKE